MTGELLASLVAFPTESRTPNRELIDFAAERLARADGRVTIIDGPPGRANLLASFGPDGPGGLLLSGHTDVVPAGAGWATPPYELTAIGDRMHGRGAADMKGFIACVLAVVRSTRRPLHVALSYDEEIGCVGVRSLLAELAPLGVAPELVLVGEPTMMRPRNSHLGKVAYDVDIRTVAGHSSRSHTMPNAISAAASVIAAIDSVQRAHIPVTIDHEPQVTVNVGTMRGGTGLNVIADACSFAFELRHDAEHDPDRLMTPVWDEVARQRARAETVGGSVTTEETVRYPALATDPSQSMVGVVEQVAAQGLCTPIGYGTEGGLFAATLGVPVVICGPGDIAVAHRADEYVTIDQLMRCERFLSDLITAVCGT